MKLQFIGLRGVWVHSRLISAHTGGLDHIAFKPSPGPELIEALNHGGGLRTYWDWSSLDVHPKGTEWELWEIEVNWDVYEAVHEDLRQRAAIKEKYPWLELFSFGILFFRAQPGLKVCSTGCLHKLAESSGWDRLLNTKVDPEEFVGILQAAGGLMIDSGVIE